MKRTTILALALSLINAYEINLSEQDISDLCVPHAFSTSGEIQFVESVNGSIYSQQLDVFEAVSNVTIAEFSSELPALSAQLSASTGVQQEWSLFTSGTRTVTMPYQCMFASPGCTTPYNTSLYISIAGANNSNTWSFLAQVPPLSDQYANSTQAPVSKLPWGGCYLENCTESYTPVPGDILLYMESKCVVMQWQLPLPTGVDFIVILTDPKGNEYIEYSFNNSFIEPDSQNYPDGWTLSKKTLVEEEIFTISPLESGDTCREMNSNGTSPCTYVSVEDSDGNAYHRYLYVDDGEIMVYPIQAGSTTPEQPAICAAECTAESAA
eukprot:CFRG7820T1